MYFLDLVCNWFQLCTFELLLHIHMYTSSLIQFLQIGSKSLTCNHMVLDVVEYLLLFCSFNNSFSVDQLWVTRE